MGYGTVYSILATHPVTLGLILGNLETISVEILMLPSYKDRTDNKKAKFRDVHHGVD